MFTFAVSRALNIINNKTSHTSVCEKLLLRWVCLGDVRFWMSELAAALQFIKIYMQRCVFCPLSIYFYLKIYVNDFSVNKYFGNVILSLFRFRFGMCVGFLCSCELFKHSPFQSLTTTSQPLLFAQLMFRICGIKQDISPAVLYLYLQQ